MNPKEKKILMIDRNFMVDRRIVLEAKLLREAGQRVALVATYSTHGSNERSIDGLPILRFPELEVDLTAGVPDVRVFDDIATWKPPLPQGVSEAEAAANARIAREKDVRSEARFRRIFPAARRYLGRAIGGGLAALLAPSFSMGVVARSGLPSVIKRPAVLLLALFSGKFSVASQLAAPARELPDQTPLIAPLNPALQEYFAAEPLDMWEHSVIQFALGLDKIDVVHVHDLPAVRVGVVIAQTRKLPLIYDAHELYSYQPGVEGERKDKLFNTEHRLIGYCDEVVVINSDQAAVMAKDHDYHRFTPLTNATEQPEGFDITRRYSKVRDQIALPEDAKLMLFMGGINRGRKIHFLLEGMAKAKNPVHIVFLTWGMEISEFEALAGELGIGDRVHFLPPIPWSEIVYWAASVDIGVMPYQAEDLNTTISSPNKMYEFIAAGTAMIGSSELVNVERVVGKEGFGVLVPFHVSEDYARAIDMALDPALGGVERFRPALIKNAHKYLWDAEAQAFSAMYSRVLSGQEDTSMVK